MPGNKIKLKKTEIELIEELTLMNETMGLPPAMAKIVSLLTVIGEMELTFDQIKDTLGLSKSATSQALSQLLLFKKISYKNKIGDRKRYFHLRVLDWDTVVMGQLQGISATVAICKKILASRSSKNTEFDKSLEELLDFCSFIYDQAVIYSNKRAARK